MNMKQMRTISTKIDIDQLIAGLKDRAAPDEKLLALLEESDELYDQAIKSMSNEDAARFKRQIASFFHADCFVQILKSNLMGADSLQDAIAMIATQSFRAGIRVSALAAARGVKLWAGISTHGAKTS